MATTITNTTFSTTYKDDFADSDNYHRILFNAGRALQARELTQMQTITQKEIERFGSNIFREGAPVRAGNITLNTSYEYIKLDTSLNPLPADTSTLIGLELTVKSPDPNIKVKVLEVVAASGADPATLYVRYTDTSAGTSGSDPIRVPNGVLLSGAGIDDLKVASSGGSGRGTKGSVDNGDYFIQGHFVFAARQSIFVSKYSATPTADIGFRVDETVVTVEDDNALYDNQGATPNLTAPGADRYRISLTLTTRDNVASDENFVYLARITDGIITDEITADETYNKINDVLALRTKEESGNYVVKPFIAKFDDLNDSNLQLNVSSGIAYVDGYRLDIPTNKITVPKAQTTTSLASQNVIAQYGNYVIGDASDNSGIPDVSTFDEINLRSDSSYSGSTIGTARVRAVQEDGANHNYYLFDIQMNSGSSFRSVKSFGNSGTDFVNIIQEAGISQLKSTSNNSLLFPLPNERPSSTGVTISALTIQKRYTFTTDGSGNYSGLAAGSGLTFTDKFQWVVSETTGPIANPTITLTTGDTQADFSGLSNSTDYIVLAYTIKSAPIHRTKSLNTGATLTVSWPSAADSDGAGFRYIDLGTADIYQVSAIKEDDSDGVDLSTNFVVDNGQRDNFYAKGRLIERGGVTIPTGNIYIKFDHFTHAASGDYFSVNSYDGVVSYDNIPSHRKNNGETINLRDVLDFRPVQDTSGGYTGTQGVINPLPQNTDAITGTVEYYLPRKDRLVATVQNSRDGRFGRGSLRVIQGIPALTPQYPELPTGSIPLYDIALNAYTLDETDMQTSFYANRRFTMKDISRLEERIDELTELTTLSLLEANASTLAVYDSAGLDRTKSGFLADNFSNYTYSDTTRDEYRAAINPANNTLSVQSYPTNVRLLFDSAEGTNTAVRRGDLVMLPYTDTSFIDQNLATETINVNPFAVITQTGHTELSPASDAWVETQYTPDIIVDGGTITREVGGTVRTNSLATWENSWFGRPTGDRVQVITGSRVIREIIGERIVEVEILPFMRSIKVAFRAQALRPNTRFWPFFGGVDVSNWVREEGSYTRFAETVSDIGNIYTNLTAHPDGATNLVSDAEGKIVGSFVIPSTPTVRFRTGQQLFKLLDISVDNEDAATSFTRATFTSSGVLETVQRTIRSTRQLDVQWVQVEQDNQGGENSDPLAQSFRIDQFVNRSGIFLPKVRLYFSTKDDVVPVQVQIRTMENGYPTGGPIPGAVKFLSPSEVSIPADITDITSVRAAPTDFTFDEPIYLAPGQEYAIVILAESIDYNVYGAKTYDFLLGSTEARVSRQPTLGSLFLSQNARTWNADQTRDLMFQLYRSEFDASGVALLENGATANYLLSSNPFLTTNADSDIRVFHPGHGFIKNDRVNITGLTEDSYAGIATSNIVGTRVVTSVDYTGYTFAANTAATSSLRTGGDGIIVSQNAIYNAYIPSLATLTPENTTLDASVKLTEGASFADIQGGRNEAANGAYAKDTTYSDITINEFNPTETAKLIASDSNETLSLSGAKSFSLLLNLATSDTKVSPVIDLQRANLTLFENIIDNQDSSSEDGFNIPLSFVSESHPTDGSAAAKHVTSQVTLEEPAVGLKIIFAANRPSTSDFKVYYKTGTGDDVLDDKNWTLVTKEADVPADDDGTTFRDYEYLAGGVGGSLTPFTVYQVKIVFTSTNSSKVPVIQDLRAIALAV